MALILPVAATSLGHLPHRELYLTVLGSLFSMTWGKSLLLGKAIPALVLASTQQKPDGNENMINVLEESWQGIK